MTDQSEKVYLLLNALKASKKQIVEDNEKYKFVAEISVWTEDEIKQLKQEILNQLKLKKDE